MGSQAFNMALKIVGIGLALSLAVALGLPTPDDIPEGSLTELDTPASHCPGGVFGRTPGTNKFGGHRRWGTWEECLQKCRDTSGCKAVLYGFDWEKKDCTLFKDTYNKRFKADNHACVANIADIDKAAADTAAADTQPPCVGRDSFISPYDGTSGCKHFTKGVVTLWKSGTPYESYNYCTKDEASSHCFECDKCADTDNTADIADINNELPMCSGRDSFVSPYNGESGCEHFKKGVITPGKSGKPYEFYKYCTPDKVIRRCSECDKCADF